LLKGDPLQVRTRNVNVYQAASGKVPFDEWMAGLKDVIGKAAIEARIAMLRRGIVRKGFSRGRRRFDRVEDKRGARLSHLHRRRRKKLINPAGWEQKKTRTGH
jgi:hypothetical protein